MTTSLDVILFKRTPARVRPLMIIITALALGFICLGVVLTIIGNWPGFTPYGGNPLRIVGPILLGVGCIAFIAVTVDCCVRASKNQPIYEKEKVPQTVAFAGQQPGVHPYASKYSEPKSYLNQSAPSSTSYNTTKSGPPSSYSQPPKNGSGPPPAPPIPAGGIPTQRQTLIDEGYKPLDMQRHWGDVPVEMRQLPEERMPKQKKVHDDLQEASLAALMGQGTGQGNSVHFRPKQKQVSPVHATKAGGEQPAGKSLVGNPGALSNADGVQLRKGPANRPETLDFKPAPVQAVPQAVATGQANQVQQPKWGKSAAKTTTTDDAATTPGDRSPGELDKEKSDSKKSLPVLQIPLSYKSENDKNNDKDRKDKHKKEQEAQQKSKANYKSKSKGAQNKGFVTDEDLWPIESTPKDDQETHGKGHYWKEGTPKSRRKDTSKSRDSSRGRDREKEREREKRDRARSSERGRHRDRDDHKRRSRSQEPKGSRSRDSSRGRRSSTEEFNSMNYLSGKPRPNKDGDDRHQRRTGDHRYTNRAFDPDESTDSSAKRRKREKERERSRDRDRHRRHRDHDDYSEAPSSAIVPSGRYRIPRRHNTSMSEVGTVIDEPLNKVVNPKYTININAQPGAAVQIGFPKGGVPSFRVTRGDGIADLDSVSMISSSRA